jgi:peptide/nickel transport system permease protein
MRTVAKKLIQLIVVLFFVTFFSFSLLKLIPGDPVSTLKPFATPEQAAAIRTELGLDEPFFTQYYNWLKAFVKGDPGIDYSTGEPVKVGIGKALPVTLQLVFYAQVIALVVALPLGILTAYKAGTWFDKVTNTTAFGLLALPGFVLGLILIYYFGVQLKILPTQQYVPFGENPAEHFKHMILPAISLAVGQIAIYMRLLRSDMIQTLQEDFITMAKAKGLTNRRILLRHAMRPSTFSLLTVAALNVGALIGGAVIIEAVFQLPGLGLKLVQAVATRQYVALQAYVCIIAVFYVGFNALVDILYVMLDPRIRHARA